jgi:hypothetical protein
MDEELKQRFLIKKIEDLRSNDVKPLPTILCERDDPRIMEVVRKFCMFSEKMVPYRRKHNLSFVEERLEVQHGMVDYGELYILVSVN